MAVSDPTLGDIILWPTTFAPRNWAFCDGRLLAIPQNAALFSLISTYYGGDGRTTFALPDLRGRLPMGAGFDPRTGQSFYIGQTGGANTFEFNAGLTVNQTVDEGPAVVTAPASLPLVPPYRVLNYIIAVQGWYPQRS